MVFAERKTKAKGPVMRLEHHLPYAGEQWSLGRFHGFPSADRLPIHAIVSMASASTVRIRPARPGRLAALETAWVNV